MKTKPLPIRWAVAILVGSIVLVLSFLSAWNRSQYWFMTNETLHTWTRSAMRSIDRLILERIEQGSGLPQSLGELTADLEDETFANSKIGIIKHGVPVDGWGRPLLYSVHGTSYTLISHGRDGMPGGKGLDQEISSSTIVDFTEAFWTNPPMPSLHQFLFELPSGNMLRSCALSGLIAFFASFHLVRAVPTTKRDITILIFRIVLTLTATLIFAHIIMYLHIPSTH